MDTKSVKTVAMFGPSLSDPSRTVNRDVPERDVQAYKAAGYQVGSIPEEPKFTPDLHAQPSPVVEAPKEPAKGKKK